MPGTRPRRACPPHWDLAKKYNIIDFETGVKVTEPVSLLYRKGEHVAARPHPVLPDEAGRQDTPRWNLPFVVNEASGYGTGQLPDKEDRCTM